MDRLVLRCLDRDRSRTQSTKADHVEDEPGERVHGTVVMCGFSNRHSRPRTQTHRTKGRPCMSFKPCSSSRDLEPINDDARVPRPTSTNESNHSSNSCGMLCPWNVFMNLLASGVVCARHELDKPLTTLPQYMNTRVTIVASSIRHCVPGMNTTSQLRAYPEWRFGIMRAWVSGVHGSHGSLMRKSKFPIHRFSDNRESIFAAHDVPRVSRVGGPV